MCKERLFDVNHFRESGDVLKELGTGDFFGEIGILNLSGGQNRQEKELWLMDLSPIRQNFEKNRNRQKFHNSLKENPMFSKIAKFGCEML